jgi:hypothetical protein
LTLPHDSAPLVVEFTATDEDVLAVRTFRERRRRLPLLEWCLHALAALVALLLVLAALLSSRWDRFPTHAMVLVVIWAAAWAYLAFVAFRRTPEGRAWFEKLRNGSVISTGRCRVAVDDHGLVLTTAVTTRAFRPEQLDDQVV